jgi:Short-chain alcohol dehydrogenase of unknown specificity
MKKKEIIVTGSTGSIGAATAEALVAKGFPIVMACRNDEKALLVKNRILESHPKASIKNYI